MCHNLDIMDHKILYFLNAIMTTDRGDDTHVRRCLVFPADLTKMTDLGGRQFPVVPPERL